MPWPGDRLGISACAGLAHLPPERRPRDAPTAPALLRPPALRPRPRPTPACASHTLFLGGARFLGHTNLCPLPVAPRLPKYACQFIEMCLMVTADHGPAVSGAHNTIICARAGKDLVSSLTSGLLTIVSLAPDGGGEVVTGPRWENWAEPRGPRATLSLELLLFLRGTASGAPWTQPPRCSAKPSTAA